MLDDGYDYDYGYDSYDDEGFVEPESYDVAIDSQECNAACSIEMLDEHGEYVVYDISAEELDAGVELPVYMTEGEEGVDGTVTMALSGYAKVATFTVRRISSGTIYWHFSPTSVGMAILTLGFTGTAKLTNFAGMSCGQFFYIGRISGQIPTSPDRRHFILSGTYSVIGYLPIEIFFYRYL